MLLLDFNDLGVWVWIDETPSILSIKFETPLPLFLVIVVRYLFSLTHFSFRLPPELPPCPNVRHSIETRGQPFITPLEHAFIFEASVMLGHSFHIYLVTRI